MSREAERESFDGQGPTVIVYPVFRLMARAPNNGLPNITLDNLKKKGDGTLSVLSEH